jgi:uncharacterized membrane protein
MDLSLY